TSSRPPAPSTPSSWFTTTWTPAASNATSAPAPEVCLSTAAARSSFTGSTTTSDTTEHTAVSLRARETSLTIVDKPLALSTAATSNPIGPAPPTTATCPDSAPECLTACKATESGSIIAAWSRGISPTGWTHRCSTTMCSLRPPPSPEMPMKPICSQRLYLPFRQAEQVPSTISGSTTTESPTETPSTPSPTSSTVPENSWPNTTGRVSPEIG